MRGKCQVSISLIKLCWKNLIHPLFNKLPINWVLPNICIVIQSKWIKWNIRSSHVAKRPNSAKSFTLDLPKIFRWCEIGNYTQLFSSSSVQQVIILITYWMSYVADPNIDSVEWLKRRLYRVQYFGTLFRTHILVISKEREYSCLYKFKEWWIKCEVTFTVNFVS